MLSVWIRGTGLRAHVEPFEDRGNDDGDDMYNDESCYVLSSLSLGLCLSVSLLRFILTPQAELHKRKETLS